MTDTWMMLTLLGLIAFLCSVFGALARTKPDVDLTLQVKVGKVSFGTLRAHGYSRFFLDIALLSLIQQKRISWRFDDGRREQRSGLPPPFQLAQCTFWHTRNRGGIRASPLLVLGGSSS